MLETKAYWQELLEVAQRGQREGTTPDAEARKWLADGTKPKWTEAHRLVVNLDTAYRDLAGDCSHRDPLELFARMSRLERT